MRWDENREKKVKNVVIDDHILAKMISDQWAKRMEEDPEIKATILQIEDWMREAESDGSELVYNIIARAADMITEYTMKSIEEKDK